METGVGFSRRVGWVALAVIVATAVFAALGAPATARAPSALYEGKIQPRGSLYFFWRTSSDPEQLIRFNFKKVPVDCKHGAGTASGFPAGIVAVVNREIKFNGSAFEKNGGGEKVKIRGRIAKDGESASGTIRIKGKYVLLDGKPTDRCDSGKLKWSTKLQDS